MRLPIPPRRRYVSVIYNLYYSYYSNRNINIHIDYKLYTCKPYVMDGEGFEPSKASPADLQSVPFGHSGIHPWMNLLYTKKKVFARYFFSFFDVLHARACLKKHSRNLPAPLCSIFCLNSVAVARYGAFIRTKSSTNCDAHLAESFFQIRSRWMKKESITHFFCKEVDEWGKIC